MNVFKIAAIALFCVFAVPAFAQEGIPPTTEAESVAPEEMEMVAVADVNVGDVVVSEKDGQFEGTFTVEGRMGMQDNIFSGIVVQDKSGAVVDVHSFGKTSPLLDGEIRQISFSYTLPERLGGELTIAIMAETASGLPLGYALVKEVTLPEKESVFSCVQSENRKDMICTHKEGGVLAVASFDGSLFSSPEIVNEYGLEKGVPTTISFPTTPGRFTLRVTDTDTGEFYVGGYSVKGAYGTVHNLILERIDEQSPTVNGTLVVEVSAKNGFDAVVELVSGEGTMCGKKELVLDGLVTQFEIETTCGSGTAKVILRDSEGATLDTYETAFMVGGNDTPQGDATSVTIGKTMRMLGVIGALFIVMLTVLGIRKLIERGVLTFLFFIACLFGSYMAPQSAHALTLMTNVSGPYGCGACNIAYTSVAVVNTDRSSYNPGDTMQVTWALTVDEAADGGASPDDTISSSVAFNSDGAGVPVWDVSWPTSGSFPVQATTGGYIPYTSLPFFDNGVLSFTIPGTMAPGTHFFANRVILSSRNWQGNSIGAAAMRSGDLTFTVVAGTPPATPGNFDVTPVNTNCATPGQGRMDVSWNSVSGATGYTVRINNTTTGVVSTVTTGATSYIHSGLSAVHHVEYSVRADNGSVSSPWTTPKPMVVCAPPTPQNFNASPNACGAGGGVGLTWTAVSDPHWAGYQIFRNDPGFGWVAIATVPSAGATSYIDLTAPAGVSASYRIEAQAIADSEPSSASSATAPTCVPPGQPDLAPSAPSVSVASVAQGGTITFNTNTIANSGAVAAGPHNIGGFYIDADGNGTTDYTAAISRQTNSIPAGGSYTQSVNWTVPLGATPGTNYRVRYMVDSGNEVSEVASGEGIVANTSGWGAPFTVQVASACHVRTSVGGTENSWYPPIDSDFDDYWMRFADPNLNFVAAGFAAPFRERACATSPLNCTTYGYFTAGAATTRPAVPAACATYAPRCSNGIDDDGDGLSDTNDPGCHPDNNAGNPASYTPTDTDESNPAPNTAPNVPTVTGPTTPYGLYPFEVLTYTFGATDPDGDPIRFVIDLDNDGSNNDTTPSVGYIPSGGTQIGNYSWTTPGTKFVAVRAVDDNGATSSPRIVSVDLFEAIPVLTLPTHTAVTQDGATLGATVASKGGTATLSARGTCWGTTNPPPTLPSANCLPEPFVNIGPFTHPRTGMPGNTTIYYWGYATNHIGTGYSPVASFTTLTGGAPSVSLTASPNPINSGDSTTLTWTVTGTADSCWASGGWSGWQSFTGTNSVTLSPITNTTYTIECWNAGLSSGPQSVTVAINPGSGCPPATLSGCTLPSAGVSEQRGACASGYAGSCTYTCAPGNSWQEDDNSCTGPIITRFEICDPDGVTNCDTARRVGTSTPLRIIWNSVNADDCQPVLGSFSTGGSTNGGDDITSSSIPGGTDQYRLVCTRDGQMATAYTSLQTSITSNFFSPEIQVTLPSATTPIGTVNAGTVVWVRWDSNNGDETACTLSGGGLTNSVLDTNGGDPEEGYEPVTVQGRSTFTIECDGQRDAYTIDVIPQNWES